MASKKNSSPQKIRIVIKSYDHHLSNEASKDILEALERSGSVFSGPIPMPTRIRKFSLLRSTNCSKNSFEQFEIRTHKRIIDILEASSEAVSVLQQLQMPSGVDIELKML